MSEFSVIIPSYNHGRYLRQAVESALNQDVAVEVIVVDDGSSDDSLSILGALNDPRLQVHPQENQGAHAAINRGLALAQGEYLAILNSDDEYLPGRLAHARQHFAQHPAVGLVASHIEIIDSNGKSLGVKQAYHTASPWPLPNPARSFRASTDLRLPLLTENYLATTSNYVFRRALWQAAGPFWPLRYTHDWDFALHALQHTELAMLPQPLMRYRVHGHNTIRENRPAMVFEICWCLARHLPTLTQQPWFWQNDLPNPLEALLNSVYVFGAERVLVAMLALQLHQNAEQAQALLQPDNPLRATLLHAIQDDLQAAPPPPQGWRQRLVRWFTPPS